MTSTFDAIKLLYKENKWLRDEIQELKEIIAAILTKNADCVIVSEKSLEAVENNADFTIEYDARNRVYKLIYRDKHDKANAV